MLKIAKSLIVIVAVVAVAAGATGAYFSSSVDISDNTFSTGTLEIRVDGQDEEIDGVAFGPAAPGACYTHTWTINNYGAPWFAGPSNLPAKQLLLTVNDVNDEGGSADLWNALTMKIEANRGWPTWMLVYDGPANAFGVGDLLSPRWTELIPGSSEEMKATICLPDSGGDQSDLMGLTAEWDFIVEGRTS